MCTCIDFSSKHHYFGRTLDLDHHYNEEVVITPRDFRFELKNGEGFNTKYAIIGMATMAANYPLYYEASNESGLAMAGLYFLGNAKYYPPAKDKLNLAVFELMPYILGLCNSVAAARQVLSNLNISNATFNEDFLTSPMHWMLADRDECIVVEQTTEGLQIYDNPAHCMTNNPTFDLQLALFDRVKDFRTEHVEIPSEVLEDYKYRSGQNEPKCSFVCDGYGAYGLPGDQSSGSRFIRASFNLMHAQKFDDEINDAVQFFHILDSVSDVQGTVISKNNAIDSTIYTSCIDTDTNVYYYKTYENPQISAVRLTEELCDAPELVRFPLASLQINLQN